MQPFETLESVLIPLIHNDIDTDQIIPARYLKVTDKSGLADGLFSSWRYLPDGKPDPDFPLNRPEYQNAQILLAGDNFGCGSSREHAPWALVGWGIRAVISTSFADIFRNNALKNGLLPVTVDARAHAVLVAVSETESTPTVGIDLGSQTLRLPNGDEVTFPIDQFSKMCLIKGIDQLGYLLEHKSQIAAYEKSGQL
ncbi:MAG: 3-isopropylmalate dehydratase small subunit [Chloroflexota bacterium]|nr:3-isopropylmalate dehydratase small subunit [Chloroflexota bacterium]